MSNLPLTMWDTPKHFCMGSRTGKEQCNCCSEQQSFGEMSCRWLEKEGAKVVHTCAPKTTRRRLKMTPQIHIRQRPESCDVSQRTSECEDRPPNCTSQWVWEECSNLRTQRSFFQDNCTPDHNSCGPPGRVLHSHQVRRSSPSIRTLV